MNDKLVCKNNSLADLINWSKNGYMIILNKKYVAEYFLHQNINYQIK